jgi:hypothetical protein
MGSSPVTVACLTDEQTSRLPLCREIAVRRGGVGYRVHRVGRFAEPSSGEGNGGLEMRIGTGIFLLALGAILAFAVDYDISGIELSTVGWILMAAGALAIVLFLTVWAPRDRPVGRAGVVEERRVYDDGPPPP